MIHVLVVAAQLLNYRSCSCCWRCYRTLSAQYTQQVAQRGAKTASITLNLSGATASQKMVVKKLGDGRLVDASER